MPAIASSTPVDSSLRDSLRDIVLGMLSHAAVEGTTRVPLGEFQRAFEVVVVGHRNMFPPMHFTKSAYSVYSKRLDDALQSVVGFSVDLPNPQLQFLEVTKDAAKRHLAWLEDKYGRSAVDKLKPLAKAFVSEAARSGD
jgi:hypothetical protein